MDFFRQVFNQIRDIVRGMNRSQQFILGTICVAVIAAVIALVAMSSKPSLVPLTPETMTYEAASEVQKYLDEKRIPYSVEESKLYVPSEVRSKLLLELYGEGKLPEGKDVWEWVFGDSFAESKDRRDMRLLVSKKREIKRYLMMMPFIKTASIIEKIPQDSFTFNEAKDHGTASVMLTLKSGMSLSAVNVNAIANLVANAFGSMEPQDVAIIADGNLYSVLDRDDMALQSATHLDIKRKEEKFLEDSVRSFFAQFFPVVVKVNLKMDFTKQKIHSEEHVAIVVNSTSTETSEPVLSAGTGGIPGMTDKSGLVGQTSPSTPLSVTNPSSGGGEIPMKTASSETETSDVYPKTLTESEVPPGTIKDTSIAIVVPYEKALLLPGGKAADKKNAQAQLDENIKTWKTQVARICGMDNEEKISITAMSFPEPEPFQEPSGVETATDILGKYGPQIALLAILLSLLFIGYRFVIRKSMPTELMKELEKAKKDLEPPAELPQIEIPELSIPAPDMKIAQMREWVKDTVKKNPRVAANLVKRWIKS